MHRVTVKTSTIFIAKGGKTKVYRSVQEMPQRLRQELEQSTNGFKSATILIAERRGREEILRALQGMPSALRTRLASSLSPGRNAASEAQPRAASAVAVLRFVRRNWIEIVLPAAVGGILWLAFNYH